MGSTVGQEEDLLLEAVDLYNKHTHTLYDASPDELEAGLRVLQAHK
jgi:hypothetical protein